MKRVFPRGVATEDARAEVGNAPAPPEASALDAEASYVGTFDLRSDLNTTAVIRAAMNPDRPTKPDWHPEVFDATKGTWIPLTTASPGARFDRLVPRQRSRGSSSATAVAWLRSAARPSTPTQGM